MGSNSGKLTRFKAQAWAALQARKLDEAVAWFTRAAQLAKSDVESTYMVGLISGQLADYEKSVQWFRRALSMQPNMAEGYFNLGLALQSKGDLVDAIDAYSEAVRLNPRLAEAHYNLGNTLFQMGRSEEAERAYRAALDTQPTYADAWSNLGATLRALGRNGEALDAYERVLKLRNGSPDDYHRLASCFMEAGDLDSAVRTMENAVGQHREDAESRYRLGTLYHAQGRLDLAEQSLLAALGLDAHHAPAGTVLGMVYNEAGDQQRALECFRRVTETAPEHADAHVGLASSLLSGLVPDATPEDALAACRRAAEIEPGHVGAAIAEAHIYERMGKLDKALEKIAPLIEENSVTADAAVVFADLCHQQGRFSEGVEVLERAFQRRGLPVGARRQMHFSLGRLYGGLGDYRRSFEHYRSGNDLKFAYFDPDAHSRWVNDIIETFNETFFSRIPHSSNRSRRPIFIVGMPRSGTTLVEQVLASHPDVFGAGELNRIRELSNRVGELLQTDLCFPASARGLTGAILDALAGDYLDHLREIEPDSAFVTDKMPSNFLYLGLINRMFPGAKIIHCVRDPLDTCLSCYFHDFAGHNPYTYDIEHLGRYYLDYERLMEHWRSVLRNPLHELHYEALVADQESETRRLLAYCNLPWNDACLRFDRTQRFVSTASYGQVRKPLYRTSVARWKRYEADLAPLVRLLDPVYRARGKIAARRDA